MTTGGPNKGIIQLEDGWEKEIKEKVSDKQNHGGFQSHAVSKWWTKRVDSIQSSNFT